MNRLEMCISVGLIIFFLAMIAIALDGIRKALEERNKQTFNK